MTDTDTILLAFLIFMIAWIPLAAASLAGKLGDGQPSGNAFRVFRATIVFAILSSIAIVARFAFIAIA